MNDVVEASTTNILFPIVWYKGPQCHFCSELTKWYWKLADIYICLDCHRKWKAGEISF